MVFEHYPKPRHNYIFTPRYGQRGIHTYAGQQANGALPSGPVGMLGGYGYGMNMGMGMGYGMGSYPVYSNLSYPQKGKKIPTYHGSSYYNSYYPNYYSGYSAYPSYMSYPSYYPNYSAYGGLGGIGYGGYGGYHNYGLYGSMYPLANFYSPYQRSYYTTTMPYYGMPQTAMVYPPGPTTTTTTYHVTNSHAAPVTTAPPAPVRTTCAHNTTREDIQMENRRIATERGAYSARRIKPADARDDDPFWCRERNGEWHLRTFYQIENECYPGQWLMDAELGFLVFHRG